jgi:NAD(P)-dependent dehydrogenase (short-subunit alcohol dehydrogenase family)
MDLGLEGKVALIAGGSGRIGRAVGAALVEEGATVVLAARSAGPLADAAEALGASSVLLDTADDASVSAAIADVLARHGRIDVLVNTAAPSASTLDPARATDPSMIVEAIDGKAMGYLRVMNAVLPGMLAAGSGRIVNVSGQNALLSDSIPAAARNGVVSVASKVLADSVAGSGVGINVVNPGPVTDHPDPQTAHGRPGQSTYAEVADLVTFLCCARSRAISGETVAVGHRVRGHMVL